MPDSPTDCTLADGQVLDLATATAEQLAACKFKRGAVLHLEDEGEEEDVPTAPPTPEPPMAPAPLPPPSTPQLPNLPTRKPMEPTQTPDVVPSPVPTDVHAAPSDGAVDVAAGAQTPATAEHVEVPATTPSAGELGDLISKSGGGAFGLIAALIAVVGGTAGFKLWTKISEQKHEQSMKKLDIEQANAGLSGAQPPPCQAAHHTLVADIKSLQGRAAALEARVEKLEKASAGFDPSVDVGDLEERVEVLEKAFRKKARTSGGE